MPEAIVSIDLIVPFRLISLDHILTDLRSIDWATVIVHNDRDDHRDNDRDSVLRRASSRLTRWYINDGRPCAVFDESGSGGHGAC